MHNKTIVLTVTCVIWGLVSGCGKGLDQASKEAEIDCEVAAPGPIGTNFSGGLYTGFCTNNSTPNYGGAFHYVISPSGCELSETTNPNCSGSDLNDQRFDSTTPEPDFNGVTNRYRGDLNTAAIANLGVTKAATNYCANLSLNGFTDWYLPAAEEMLSIQNLNIQASGNPLNISATAYWSSTEAPIGQEQDSVSITNGVESTTHKYTILLTRCIRRVPVGN